MNSPKWARRLLLIGSWVLIACGVLHTVGYSMARNSPPENDTERQLNGLMRNYRPSSHTRTMQEMVDGFSLTFTILPIALGAICILVARSSDSRLQRNVAMAAAVALAAESTVSILFWFPAPTVFLVASTLAFVGSRIAASDS
jgi:hypothetical protein